MAKAKKSKRPLTWADRFDTVSRACEIIGRLTTSDMLCRAIYIVDHIYDPGRDPKSNDRLCALMSAKLAEMEKEIFKAKSDKRQIQAWNKMRQEKHGLPPVSDPFKSRDFHEGIPGGA